MTHDLNELLSAARILDPVNTIPKIDLVQKIRDVRMQHYHEHEEIYKSLREQLVIFAVEYFYAIEVKKINAKLLTGCELDEIIKFDTIYNFVEPIVSSYGVMDEELAEEIGQGILNKIQSAYGSAGYNVDIFTHGEIYEYVISF